jgi:para-nitrobenzyl esterase
VYRFEWPTPVMDGRLRACHGLEIPFVFSSVDHESVFIPPVTPAMEELSRAMHAAWAAFARHGDPNHAGVPEWPAYEASGRPTMMFDEQSAVEIDPYGEELALVLSVDARVGARPLGSAVAVVKASGCSFGSRLPSPQPRARR